MGRRNHYLDRLRGRGIAPEFYDPDGQKYGLPTYPYRMAPDGLWTRRQLRERDLAPGGRQPDAQLLWRHRGGQRVAYLYNEGECVPKRTPSPAQLEAVGKALAARKTCPSCGVQQDYYIPKSLGECLPCAEGIRRIHPPEPEYDEELEAG